MEESQGKADIGNAWHMHFGWKNFFFFIQKWYSKFLFSANSPKIFFFGIKAYIWLLINGGGKAVKSCMASRGDPLPKTWDEKFF